MKTGKTLSFCMISYVRVIRPYSITDDMHVAIFVLSTAGWYIIYNLSSSLNKLETVIYATFWCNLFENSDNQEKRRKPSGA